MHTDCTVCAAGHAGVDGVCGLCTSGSAPSSDLTECLMCNDPNEFDQVSHSWASATGHECVACVAGRAADATNSECDVCPPGRYSSDGVTCSFCPPGEEPNVIEFSVGATHCIECLNGTHRHNEGGDLAMSLARRARQASSRMPRLTTVRLAQLVGTARMAACAFGATLARSPMLCRPSARHVSARTVRMARSAWRAPPAASRPSGTVRAHAHLARILGRTSSARTAAHAAHARQATR